MKLSIKFDDKGLTRLKSILARKLDEACDDLADYIFMLSQRAVPKDIGRLRESGIVRKEHLVKTVGYTAPYAHFVEFGTAAHWPPRKVIEEWVRRKRSDFGITEKQVKSVAYLICRKIAKVGTQPHPFLRPAFEQGISKAKGVFERKVKEAIKESI